MRAALAVLVQTKFGKTLDAPTDVALHWWKSTAGIKYQLGVSTTNSYYFIFEKLGIVPFSTFSVIALGKWQNVRI